jgi:2-hydroxy-3-keto-5-methylthiopentenyl-1-phosphate phosphatase
MRTLTVKDLEKYPPSKRTVLIDFDNTITLFDVLDDIIKRFSVDKRWIALEEAWREGRIGSRECLEGQLGSVRMTKKGLTRYLSRVRLDPYFKKLLMLSRERGMKMAIVSDDFSFIIKRILKESGLDRIRIHSNAMRFRKDTFKLVFPHTNGRCGRCANCKRMHLSKYKDRNRIIIYIGDGLSDVCPAKHADLVFAKGSLLKRLRREGKRCVEFNGLADVYRHMAKNG